MTASGVSGKIFCLVVILWGLAVPSAFAGSCQSMAFRDIMPVITDALDDNNATVTPDQIIRIDFAKNTVGGTSGISQQIRLAEAPLTAACLRYQLRFPADFTFMRGGKLPGLYGGPADMTHSNASGCKSLRDRTGWTMRLMWREQGAGEGYGYLVNPVDDCGTSLDRGAWIFPRNQWIDIALYVHREQPGQQDGVLQIMIDDRLVIDRHDLAYGDGIHGLFLSSFFGGNDQSWAPSRDQFLEMRGFRFATP